MTYNKKRGQAALEFLTTYGWGFLVILIMIAALAYFGILNPSKLLPNRCNFGVEFQCLDHQISSTDGTFKLRMKNNIGEPIDITSVALSAEASTPYTCTSLEVGGVPTVLPYANWKSGEVLNFEWGGCSGGALVSGEKGKVLITVRYNTVSSGAGYIKESKGEVFSSVI